MIPVPDQHVPELRRRLLDWYREHRRDLPWRAESDPYRIWLSEVMLQQTRVEAVRPYYARWLERFPTLESLAGAPLDEVLKAWEGLGYYSRARNLHRAVREVVAEHGGRVPEDPERFRALPGVGRYTAGAVLSISFGREEPLVDGNVRRVFARWTDDAAPPDAELWRLAERLVPGEAPGDLNQALMELGATVCTPRSPRCGACPVAELCAARAAGTEPERPAPKKIRAVPHQEEVVAVVEDGARLLLVRRPVDQRLGGMWEFPGTVRSAGESVGEAARRAAREGVGTEVEPGEEIGVVEHAFTHLRVTYRAVRCRPVGGRARPLRYDACAWVTGGELEAHALPRAQKRIASLALEPTLFRG